MWRRSGAAIATALALLTSAAQAHAETVKVFVGGAMTAPLREVGAEFSRRTGNAVQIVSDTTGAIQKRLRAGETADIVVVTSTGIEALQSERLVSASGRVDLARALIGVGVHTGASLPDIASAAGLKASLLAARSVAYVDPAAGGTSGRYFEGLLQRMGIADVMKPKTVYRSQGAEVAEAVARGEAEIGITFTSELAPNAAVKVVGPLPPEIQSPAIYTAGFATSVSDGPAPGALMQALAGPAGIEAVKHAGLEPLQTPR